MCIYLVSQHDNLDHRIISEVLPNELIIIMHHIFFAIKQKFNSVSTLASAFWSSERLVSSICLYQSPIFVSTTACLTMWLQ